jgi:hypothetical protein
MAKKYLQKIALALKSSPRLLATFIRQLFQFVVTAFVYCLAFALVLTGFGIVCAHTYLFLKTGEWAFVASHEIPVMQIMESEWLGAWKIFSWLPSSLIFMALGVGVLLLQVKLKQLIHKFTHTASNSPASEPVASAK